MKRHPPEVFTRRDSQILRGKTFLSEQMSDRLIGKMVGRASDAVTQAPIDKLTTGSLKFSTDRQGASTNDIAEQLCSAQDDRDVPRHLKTKLNLRTGNELVRYAIEWSWSVLANVLAWQRRIHPTKGGNEKCGRILRESNAACWRPTSFWSGGSDAGELEKRSEKLRALGDRWLSRVARAQTAVAAPA